MTRVVVASIGYLLILGACLFFAAGTVQWPVAWVLLLLQAAVIVVACFTVDTALLRERAGIERGTQWWDPPLSVVGFLFLIPLGLILAGLQVRQRNVPGPGLIQLAGALVFLIGQLVGVWAMRVNPFFVKFVRVQLEHAHHAITSGPYAWVRHPGYVSGVLSHLGAAVLLGSSWAVASVLIGGALFLARTVLEDRFLKAQLPGYREYANRVRWRWLPGIW